MSLFWVLLGLGLVLSGIYYLRKSADKEFK